MKRLLQDLPLGTRFRYLKGQTIWVLLDRSGCGLIVEWSGVNGPIAGQSLCSVTETIRECEEIEVEVVDPTPLQPISTAPRDGTWVLLFGPSGYVTTPLRAEVGRYYPAYRPLNPWQNHSNDAFTDGGPEPTHWMELPTL